MCLLFAFVSICIFQLRFHSLNSVRMTIRTLSFSAICFVHNVLYLLLGVNVIFTFFVLRIRENESYKLVRLLLHLMLYNRLPRPKMIVLVSTQCFFDLNEPIIALSKICLCRYTRILKADKRARGMRHFLA